MLYPVELNAQLGIQDWLGIILLKWFWSLITVHIVWLWYRMAWCCVLQLVGFIHHSCCVLTTVVISPFFSALPSPFSFLPCLSPLLPSLLLLLPPFLSYLSFSSFPPLPLPLGSSCQRESNSRTIFHVFCSNRLCLHPTKHCVSQNAGYTRYHWKCSPYAYDAEFPRYWTRYKSLACYQFEYCWSNSLIMHLKTACACEMVY